ncbi:hypothetical protein N5V55_00735 [Escherichia coli]|nr:hypothetical protein [Escherichia coli]
MAKGEITTHGTESYAAYANGTVVKAGDTLDYTNASVTLTDVDITTHGDNAHAIAARQRQFHLTREKFIQRVLTPRLLKFIMAAQ